MLMVKSYTESVPKDGKKKKKSPLCNINDLIQMIKKPLTCKQTAMA